METSKLIISLTGILIGGILLYSVGGRARSNIPSITINEKWVFEKAKFFSAEFSSGVDPLLIVAMARQESNFKPDAERVEFSIKNALSLFKTGDKSIGLMQLLTSTAVDLHEKGYRKFSKPTIISLKNPDVSIYFGMAFIDWLQKRARKNGRVYSMGNIIEWYNGGYGRSNIMTGIHSRKVLAYYDIYKKGGV